MSSVDAGLTGSTPPRPEFLDQYGLWIKREALHIHATMPWAEVDELIQWGAVALLEAMPRFDAGRGKPLEHFLRPRIRGAMLDSLRREGSHARRIKAHPEVVTESTLGAAADSGDPLDDLLVFSDAQALERATAQLDEQQQLVLQLFYVEEFNNKEIAGVLRVSESYASRLRRLALARLKRALLPAPDGPVEESVA